MPFTQQDVDALDTAYKQGLRRISSGDGKLLEFQTIDDYKKLRSLMLNDVAQMQGGSPQVRVVRIYTDSGWGS